MAGHLQTSPGPGSGADKTAPRTSPSPAEGATTRRFYYSDQWQVLEEYVGSSSTPEVRNWYGIRDINDIVRRQFIDPDDPTDLYALRDTMNVVALVNASGVVQQRMAYDAFGNTRFLTSAFAAGSNAAGWNLLFHGHYRDADTGLYQMRFRYYHPNLGVWLSRDPIGEKGGLNLYGVVRNNAANNWDPDGLIAPPLAGAAAGSAICPGVGTVIGFFAGCAVVAAGIVWADRLSESTADSGKPIRCWIESVDPGGAGSVCRIACEGLGRLTIQIPCCPSKNKRGDPVKPINDGDINDPESWPENLWDATCKPRPPGPGGRAAE